MASTATVLPLKVEMCYFSVTGRNKLSNPSIPIGAFILLLDLLFSLSYQML
jgi:hypothetical protein